MKKRITFIALCFIAIAVTAQTAHIKVSYVAHHPNLTDGKTDLTNKYILLANITESKFYSPITEYIDSLSSTPEGKMVFLNPTALYTLSNLLLITN